MTTPSPSPPAAPQTSSAAGPSLVVIAVILVGAALHWGAGILTPLALAAFLAVMIDGFARLLAERTPAFPKRAAVPTAIVLLILVFASAVFVIADNAAAFVSQLSTYTPRLNGLLARALGLFGLPPQPINQVMAQIEPTRYLGGLAQGLQSFASDAVFVLIYLGFILAARYSFRRKLLALFPHHATRGEAAHVFSRIRDGIERYLWVQTLTGLMLAVGSWAAFMVVRLDNALFWAFLIFVLSYIPIVGGAVGIGVPALFALVQFPTVWQGAALGIGLFSLHTFVGNVILPRMQGKSLNIDPVVVLLSLAFWGAIWGMPGMFLSTPLTVAVMVILAQFQGSRWIAVLLSQDGDPAGLRRHDGASAEKPAAK